MFDITKHVSYGAMKEHFRQYRFSGVRYECVNKTFTNHGAVSLPRGPKAIRVLKPWYCYRMVLGSVSTYLYGDPKPHYDDKGYALITGFSWQDGVDSKYWKANEAWLDWVFSTTDSPWKGVLGGGGCRIERLRLGKDDVSPVNNQNMEGKTYGYLLAVHTSDPAQPTAHMMIAARCVQENCEFVLSWHTYVKMGFTKVRAMALAARLLISDKDEDKVTLKNGMVFIDRFQFFLEYSLAFNENRYEQSLPDLNKSTTFGQEKDYQGACASMTTGIKSKLAPTMVSDSLFFVNGLGQGYKPVFSKCIPTNSSFQQGEYTKKELPTVLAGLCAVLDKEKQDGK